MGAALPIVGSLFKAGGSMLEADDRAYQLEDEARAAEENAVTSRAAGAYNSERQRIVGEKTEGGIRADYAASGISNDSVSALDVLRESHMASELDRQNILYGAESRAGNLENRARAARRGATSAKAAGEVNAFSALFEGGAKAYDRYGG